MRKQLILLVLILAAIHAIAGHEVTNQRLKGAEIFQGNALLTEDNKYHYTKVYPNSGAEPWNQKFRNKKIVNQVILGIDESYPMALNQGFSYTVVVDINATRFAVGGLSETVDTYQDIALTVNYSPDRGSSYIEKDQFEFEGSMKVEVVVKEVRLQCTDLSDNSLIPVDALYLQTTIKAERYYRFDINHVPDQASITQYRDGGNLSLRWGMVEGAEAYDLEWVFVDRYEGVPGEQTYDFSRDAIRVRTTGNTYTLPLGYPEGNLLFRYRPIYSGGANFDQIAEGRWSTGQISQGLVGSFSSNAKHTIAFGITLGDKLSLPISPEKNWGYSASFTDHAKASESIAFLDGLGKPRQTLTRRDQLEQVVANSTIYDAHHRPAVSLLPTPIETNQLNYQYGLNQVEDGSGSTPFDFTHFDTDDRYPDCTGPTVEPMSTVYSIGAARYYSSQNPNQEGLNAYIPDSEDELNSIENGAYPFSMIDYSTNRVGQISKQSGVGPYLQIGTNHETEYTYSGSPMDLITYLFDDNDRGQAKDYNRTVRRDPNGMVLTEVYNYNNQLVISMIEEETPSSMDPVNPAPTAATLTQELQEYSNDGGLGFTFTENVKEGEHQRFRFEFDPEAYSDDCMPSGVCYSCVYDLNIEIEYKGRCGATTFSLISGSFNTVNYPMVVGEEGTPINFTCELTPGGEEYLLDWFEVVYPERGSVTVTKTLVLKEDVQEAYANHYIEYLAKNGPPSSECGFESLTELIELEVETLEGIASPCNVSACVQECSSTLYNEPVPGEGDTNYTFGVAYQEYLDNWEPVPEPSFWDWISLNYPGEVQFCLKICEGQNESPSPCEEYLTILKNDFRPGGQYATYEIDPNSGVYSSNDPTSIFYYPLNNAALVSYVGINYPGTTWPTVDNVVRDPSSLTIEEYILHFDEAWLDELVQYHPEYCYYEYCSDHEPYFQFGADMEEASTYDEALVEYYIFSTYPDTSSSSYPDPITSSTTMWTEMGLFLSNPSNDFPGVTGNLWELVHQTIHGAPGTTLGNDICTENREWLLWRALYLSKRKEVIDNDFLSSTSSTCASFFTEPLSGHFLNKDRRIYLTLDLTTNQYGLINEYYDIPTFISELTSGNQTMVAGIAADCANTCTINVNNWIAALGDCPNLTNVEVNLRADLQALCEAGCDIANPFGATSLAPGATAIPISGSGTPSTATNVQDIIDAYFPSMLPESMRLCNAYVINTPAPSGLNFPGRYLESCGCDKVMAAEDEFTIALGAGTLPYGVTNAAQMFEHLNGVAMVDFNGDLCACQSVNTAPVETWTIAERAALAALEISVTEGLECPTCIDCEAMSEYQVAFHAHFGSVPSQWAGNPKFYDVFRNFLNQSYQHDLTFEEYERLILDCESFCTNSTVAGPGLAEGAGDIQRFLNELIEYYLWVPNNAVDIPIFFDFYQGTLYEGYTFDFENEVSVELDGASSITGNNAHLILDFVDINNCGFQATTWHLKANATWPTGFDFEDIVEFKLIEADFSHLSSAAYSGYAGGSYYDFNIVALLNDGTEVDFNECFTVETASGNRAISVFNQLVNNPNPSFCSNATWIPQRCFPEEILQRDDCVANLLALGIANGTSSYQSQIDAVKDQFLVDYSTHCKTTLSQSFLREKTYNLSMVTLYYYDQVGNLVQSIPPEGVDVDGIAPIQHRFATNYTYDSQNRLLSERSPDKGTFTFNSSSISHSDKETRFMYNNNNQLVLSINPKQKANPESGFYPYSYTLYNDRGRITESGVVYGKFQEPSGPTNIWLTNYLNERREILSHPNFPQSVDLGAGEPKWVFGYKKEVSRTFYDTPLNPQSNVVFWPNGQEHLRNRVACVTYQEQFSDNPDEYDNALHYSYDDAGNVQTMVIDLPELSGIHQRYKHIEYEYDLLSGNVNQVVYEPGKLDASYHRYTYDSDNQLKEVLTSIDGQHWDKDANYEFYDHGPLGRIELGDHKVQGVDYAYSLQGWLKATNSSVIDLPTASSRHQQDMGKDGNDLAAYESAEKGLHQHFGSDAVGFVLNYFSGVVGTKQVEEYTSIKEPASHKDHFLMKRSPSNTINAAYPNQYSGQISSMFTALREVNGDALDLIGMTYRYDQAYRLSSAKSYRYAPLSAAAENSYEAVTTMYSGAYDVNLSYDLNGNILSLQRSGTSTTPGMDDLTYHYQGGTNRLLTVEDNCSLTNNYGTDVDDQLSQLQSAICGASLPFDQLDISHHNYNYDELGNLIGDKQECIANIEWNTHGKIRKIEREIGCTPPGAGPGEFPPDLEFTYDPMGNRISKIVKPKDPSTGAVLDETHWERTYYARDPQGNPMAVYDHRYQESTSIETICDFSESCAPLNSSAMFIADYTTGPVGSGTTASFALTDCWFDQANNMIASLNTFSGVNAYFDGSCIVVEASGTNPPNHIMVQINCSGSVGGGPLESFTYFPVTVTFDAGAPQEALSIKERTLYGSSRLGVYGSDQLVAKRGFFSYDIDGLTGEMTGQVYNLFQQVKPSCESFSGLVELEMSFAGSGTQEAPSLTIEGVNLFDGMEVPSGINTLADYRKFLLEWINALPYGYAVENTGNLWVGVYGYGNLGVSVFPVISNVTGSKFGIVQANPGFGFSLGWGQNEQCQSNWERGRKRYEMSNHLGNVLSTVSDRKIQLSNTLVEDYFAQKTPHWESDKPLLLDGERLQVNSTTAGTGASRKVLLKQGSNFLVNLDVDLNNVSNASLQVKRFNSAGTATTVSISSLNAGSNTVSFNMPPATQDWQVELAVIRNDATGSAKTMYLESFVVAEDVASGAITTQHYDPDIRSYSDYYPFGMPMPGRNGSLGSYRYGFNGHEKDDEVGGLGASYSAKFWQYDSRIGRRWNIDPIIKIHESPYLVNHGDPVNYFDPDGADGRTRAKRYQKKHGGRLIETDKGYSVVRGVKGEDGIFSLESKQFKNTFGESVESFLYGIEGFWMRNTMGKSYGEGEHYIESMGIRGKGSVSANKYKLKAEAGFYSTGENNVGIYFNISYIVGEEISLVTGKTNSTSLMPKADLAVGLGAGTTNEYTGKNGKSSKLYNQTKVTVPVPGTPMVISNTTKISLTNGDVSNKSEFDFMISTKEIKPDIKEGVLYEVKYQQSSGTRSL